MAPLRRPQPFTDVSRCNTNRLISVGMIIDKVWAMPSRNTFSVPPIREFVESVVGGGENVIVDPFANASTIGTITNDLNPDFPTDYHMDALDFLLMLDDGIADVVLFDPPYSITQAAECYKSFGKEKLEINVANMLYWSKCKDHIARILKPCGYVVCCGWNSNGLGINRGFEMLRCLIVNHGGGHNDTLVTLEQKTGQLTFF